MNRIAEFEKVSYEEYAKSIRRLFPALGLANEEFDEIVHDMYDNIEIPSRSTKYSAGYDFKLPTELELPFGENVTIPTGIKCRIEQGWVLQIYPRSSIGFKYGIELSNSVGIIDGDFYNNESNEGHIMVKLTNKDDTIGKKLLLKKGQAICQGIFVQYGITESDNASGTRAGGIGSTDKS